MKKVCIVGYGAIGPIHAKALEKAEQAALYAVCDIDTEAIKKCQQQYDVIGYDSFDDMLKDDNVDVVHICTPHYLHYDMIEKALKSGKRVVCEKPITMTAEEYTRLLKLEHSNRVCVVLQNRYNLCIQKLKGLIEKGELGEICAVKGLVTWSRDEAYYQSGSWRGKWATEGGSALINQALHTLDLMVYLIGDVEGVQASMHNYSLKQVIETEDTVEARLCFQRGISGLFYASNAYGLNSEPEIEIVGTKAVARYIYGRLMVDFKVVEEDKRLDGEKAYWGGGHEMVIRDFYDHGRYLSPADIQNTMNTLFGIYRSAKQEGAIVKIQPHTTYGKD